MFERNFSIIAESNKTQLNFRGISMKNLFIVCFVVLMFCNFANAKFLISPLDERVKDSNLIVIGTLQSIVRYKTEEFNHAKGTIAIERIIAGNVETNQGFLLKLSDKIKVEWRNSNMVTCRFDFVENEKGIWFLNVDDSGTIQALSPGSITSLDELSEVKKHLRKKSGKNKRIIIQNDEQPAQISMSKISLSQPSEIFYQNLNETEEKHYYPFQMFSVILASISLYYFLYRSRFKIR